MARSVRRGKRHRDTTPRIATAGPTPVQPRPAVDESGHDTLRAYMRDLAHTPRMSPELELELGRELERCRQIIAEELGQSRAGLCALARLREQLRTDGSVAKRYFLPGSPDEDVSTLQERVDRDLARVAALLQGSDGEDAALDGAELVQALRLTDDGLNEVFQGWSASDERDQRRKQCIESARAELQCSRRRLVEANLRLVLWEIGKTSRSGLDVEDLIQEGNFALLRAAELYDPGRDVRFSSYAIWWIRARIRRALQQRNAPVRLPAHVQRRLAELRTRAQRLAIELSREPTLQELASDANLTPEATRKLLAKAATLEAVSLHAPVNENSSGSLENALPDPNAVTALDAMVERELSEWLRGVLSSLSEREKTVLMLRFGFDEQERELSLAEIAREFGLSRERVRQIETAALRRLSSGPRRAELVARCESMRPPASRAAAAGSERVLPLAARHSELPDFAPEPDPDPID